MTRRGCFDATVLVGFGFVLALVAVTHYVDFGADPPVGRVKNIISNLYKQCVYLQAYKGQGADISLVSLDDFKSFEQAFPAWSLVDYKSKSKLDAKQQCFGVVIAALPPQNIYGRLEIGLDMHNGQKSCITRDGEKRDDWSCE